MTLSPVFSLICSASHMWPDCGFLKTPYLLPLTGLCTFCSFCLCVHYHYFPNPLSVFSNVTSVKLNLITLKFPTSSQHSLFPSSTEFFSIAFIMLKTMYFYIFLLLLISPQLECKLYEDKSFVSFVH